MRFSEIAGLSPVKLHLQKAIRTGEVSHAYLFFGERGMGKRTVADTFAQTLQCEHPQEENGVIEACGKCTSCLQARNGTHPDIKILAPQKPTVIGVDDIRDQIVADSILKPFAAQRKIYLVPDAQKMNVQAQNALLKTLEEPPSYCVILLLATTETVFLPTILSRTVQLPMRPVPDETVRAYLQKQGIPDDLRMQVAVSFARGNIGKACQLVRDATFSERLQGTLALLEELPALRIDEMNARMEEILAVHPEEEEGEAAADAKKAAEKAAKEEAASDFLEIIMALMRDVLVYKATGDPAHLIFAGEMSYISKACDALSYADAAAVLDEVFTALRRIAANGNLQMVLQLFLMQYRERVQTT